MLKGYRIKYTFVHFDKIMFHKFIGYTKKSSIVTLLVYMLIFLSIRLWKYFLKRFNQDRISLLSALDLNGYIFIFQILTLLTLYILLWF